MANTFHVSIAVPVRNNQVSEQLPDRFRPEPTEHGLCSWIPIRDPTIYIHLNKCIGGCFNDLTVPPIRLKFKSLSSKSFFVGTHELGGALGNQRFQIGLVFLQLSLDPLALGNVTGDSHSADDPVPPISQRHLSGKNPRLSAIRPSLLLL